MRKDFFTVGSIVHVYNRGNRKQLIVLDDYDRQRFVLMLRYFNNDQSLPNILRLAQIELKLLKSDFNSNLKWPDGIPAQKPLVKVLAYALLNNHFHIILKEIAPGGITAFMRKLGTGMTNYFNIKYNLTGRLFQGAYKARTVNDEMYLQYLSAYIQVKNVLELFPGEAAKVIKDPLKALVLALTYPYSSLRDYADSRQTGILDKDLLGEMFKTPLEYREFINDCFATLKLEGLPVEV